MKHTITIHVSCDKGNDTITVADDAGNQRELRSVMVIGGAHNESALYCFTGGSASDLGWALGSMWRFCRMSKRKEEGHLYRSFNQMMAWICTFLGIPIQAHEIDAKTLLERIEADVMHEEMMKPGTTH